MFRKKLSLLVVFIFFIQFAQAQLSNFTLNVTKTDETCPSNGRLTFTVSNTTNGATILYSIFLLPNVTTPISVQSANSLSGLDSGNYRVVATQSLGNQSGSQQQDILIIDLVRPLAYQLSSTNETCGNDGTITVTATAGTPFNYEIFSGPMIRPLQTSNVFTGLTAGIYQVRVFDNCNQGVVQTFTLLRSETDLNLVLTPPALSSCTQVTIGCGLQTVVPPPLGTVKYPVQVVTTLVPPSGPAITYNQTITSAGGFSQLVPFYPNQTYTYSFHVTDGCGATYDINGTIQNLAIPPITYVLAPQDCTFMLIGFSNITALTLTAAPATYAGSLPRNFTPLIQNNRLNVGNLTAGTYVFTAKDRCGVEQQITIEVILDDPMGTPPYYVLFSRTCVDATIFIYDIHQMIMISAPPAYTVPLPHDYSNIINFANYAVFVNMPVGTYTFTIVDACGNTRPFTVIIAPESLPPTAAVLEGCDNSLGSLQLSGQISTISLTQAPTAYGATLPLDLTASTISGGGKLTLDNLPPGNYIFQSTNACNATFTTTVTIVGYQDASNVTITPNCGSFNLTLSHTSNNNTSAKFWLQKYNTITGLWEHPSTGTVYTDGTTPNTTNSFELSIASINYNLAFSGHFRILKSFNTFRNATTSPITCIKNIQEFDFSSAPRIIDIYSISCGSTFEVIVNAVGNSALVYRITLKDGQPFLVENGSSSLFSALAPAIYTFEVEDVCQNSVSNQFQVLNPEPLVITPSPVFCNGQSASLTVPGFSFLTYQWWQGTNTSNVLSTTSSLNFPSFNAATNNGNYHVRITYPGNVNSCLNQVLDYNINVSTSAPTAGNDNTVSYCGNQGTIDLTGLLTGTFNSGGIWSETTSSGMLNNNLWNSTNVPFATYQFKYRVSGTCNLSDEALINITIKEIPQIPTASVDPIICESQNLNLYATTVSAATYHWVGPNGFTSNDQNPVLNAVSANQNGLYTVSANQNGCNSGDSAVTVFVNPLPEFILNQGCVDNVYKLWVTRTNEASYDENASVFSWTGPNSFTSNQAEITITGGAPGMYVLTITNEHGCDAANFIDVQRNTCFIPNAITPNDDPTNQDFDLTGFGVSKLEIYNRWGRKVYEKTNYTDEWHGQNMNGGLLPDSTYYYVIELETKETKTGWIFVNRG